MPRDVPPERPETIRQALRAVLVGQSLTTRELSARVRVPEREIAAHLAHLERSLAATGERLLLEPARCRECGFRFEARERQRRPSRCPECKSERLDPPRFSLSAARRPANSK